MSGTDLVIKATFTVDAENAEVALCRLSNRLRDALCDLATARQMVADGAEVEKAMEALHKADAHALTIVGALREIAGKVSGLVPSGTISDLSGEGGGR